LRARKCQPVLSIESWSCAYACMCVCVCSSFVDVALLEIAVGSWLSTADRSRRRRVAAGDFVRGDLKNQLTGCSPPPTPWSNTAVRTAAQFGYAELRGMYSEALVCGRAFFWCCARLSLSLLFLEWTRGGVGGIVAEADEGCVWVLAAAYIYCIIILQVPQIWYGHRPQILRYD